MSLTSSLSPLARYAAGDVNPLPPRHRGRRYDRAGTFLPEPGNTVVCHLVEDSPSQAAVLEVRRRMRAMPDANRLAFTPASSLHMTLFQGIIEYRRSLPYWPADVPLDTEIGAMTNLYMKRLEGFSGAGPFRIRVVDVVPTGLTVAGATEDDSRRMRAWREALAEVFGYRHPDHDDYVFHVTLAYMIDWLDRDRLPEWQALFDDCRALLDQEAAVLELQPPALCNFEDMNHFEPLRVLG
ncbi:DUF1868 domain-containing protein [Kaistia defluvii]|uniref:DUF1868 domain-containing protein n=1 Tax=Kaistia defluvii TaxID=410841 RepID=UPI00225AC545|nr:DUF1868 domain-containing protein [Kaistia defluvii]MCX5520193.1 DUF1868 domain-containing protein [Kaistia defluvii]